MKIITNRAPRATVDACELTPVEREAFDYLNWSGIDAGTDSATFFRYRGELYDLGEFMRTKKLETSPLSWWDGYYSDSYFSGTLVKIADDDMVIVGRYYG